MTRKQFGIMLGGIAMMLPQVANAAAVTESDVNVTTPDGDADCYFVHLAAGTAPGVLVWPDIFGLRPAHGGPIAFRTGARKSKCTLPPESGVYNEPQAEKAWSRLLALHGKALA